MAEQYVTLSNGRRIPLAQYEAETAALVPYGGILDTAPAPAPRRDTFGDTAAALASEPWQRARDLAVGSRGQGWRGLGMLGLAGLSALEAGAAGAAGLAAEFVPQFTGRSDPRSHEMAVAQDLLGIGEALSPSIGRGANLLDDFIETSASAIPAIRGAASTATADTVGMARAIARGDREMLSEVMQRGTEPRSVGAAGIGDNGGPALTRPSIQIYSPSLRAARNLPQEKGSYEQMRAMLINGGAKADELEWTGFNARFGGQRSITKDEIENYLLDNVDLIDQVENVAPGILQSGQNASHYDMVEEYVDRLLEQETRYYADEVLPDRLEHEHAQIKDLSQSQLEELSLGTGKTEEYLSARPDYWVDTNTYSQIFSNEHRAIEELYGYADEMARESLYEQASQMDVVELGRELYGENAASLDEVQYPDYFTKGARDYTEKRYVLSNQADENRLREGQAGRAHWDDANVVAHARTAEFPLYGGGSAYHIGEVQSDWGQTLRRSQQDAPSFADEASILDANQKMFAAKRIEDLALSRIEDAGLLGRLTSNIDYTGESNRGRLRDRVYNITRPAAESRTILPWGDDAMRFMQQSAPVEGGLPLGYTGPENLLSRDFLAEHGQTYADYSKAVEAARELQNAKPIPGAPYVDATSKWVDYVLRQNIWDAVRSGADEITLSNPKMVRDMTGGSEEGQGAFYGEIVPKRLQKIAQQYDKDAKVGESTIITEDGPQRVPSLKLTQDFINRLAEKGIPLWSVPFGLGVGSGLLSQQGGGLLGTEGNL